MFKKQVKCSDCGFLGVHYRTLAGPGNYSDIQPLSPQARLNTLLWLQNQNAILGCFREQEYVLARVNSPTGGIDQAVFKQAISRPHVCGYFERFRPGYGFRQHLEVQKDRDQRRFLIIVSILSAAVGAAIATAANLIFSIFNR